MKWSAEKAYCEKRARQLKSEMELGIQNGNTEQFLQAYSKSFRYMTKKERFPYYHRFLEVIGKGA